LPGLSRSSYYSQPRAESGETLALPRRLDELYMERPFFGSRRTAAMLGVNRKPMQRLMRLAGIEALWWKPRLSRPRPCREIRPCLLRDVAIERPNQVWARDITSVPMRRGFLYLEAVMDRFSRYVLSWELSATLDTGFCLGALAAALRQGAPESFNTGQGWQFTAADFTGAVQQRQIRISMDGRGRWLDNVFERLWRSVK
jgi:putative transposase